VIFSPSVASPDQFVFEDSSINLSLGASPNLTDGSEFIQVTLSNIDTSWTVDTSTSGGTYNVATGVWSITLPAGDTLSGGPTFTPPSNSDADMQGNLTATVVSTNTSTGETAIATDNFIIFTDAVADGTLITANDIFGFQNSLIALDLMGSLIDIDGSEEITGYEFSGLLSGSSLSAGTDLGGGLWSITAGELTGLSLLAPTDYLGSFDMTAKAIGGEVNISDAEIIFSNNICSSYGGFGGTTGVCGTDTFSVNVSTVPVPAAIWLFGSGLVGLIGFARQKKP
jgi:hypothetical protein